MHGGRGMGVGSGGGDGGRWSYKQKERSYSVFTVTGPLLEAFTSIYPYIEYIRKHISMYISKYTYIF